jgi:hypothetical protein
VGFRHTGFSETELPEMEILGKWASESLHSRKLRRQKKHSMNRRTDRATTDEIGASVRI